MSQVVQLKGDMIAQLSKLVKKVGEQQKDLILEFSQQLNQHNELIEKALEKQERMEHKINRIEQKLMEKEIYNYQAIQEKLEQRKQHEMVRKSQRDEKRKMTEQLMIQQRQQKENELNQQKSDADDTQSLNLILNGKTSHMIAQDDQKQNRSSLEEHQVALDHEQDGFESCGEEDDNIPDDEKVEEKTGDPIKDFYLDIKSVKNKEDRKYIREGKANLYELIELLKPDSWVFEKTYQKCDLYVRQNHQNLVGFRCETTFDYPPMRVLDFIRNLEIRMMWDGQNYEALKQVKEYAMNTQMYHIKLKQQWPLGNRDILLLFQAIPLPNGDIYLAAKSTTHPDFPESDKFFRVNTKSGSYLFEPLSEGKQCRMTYITEFDFKGSLPRYMVQKAAQASFIDSLQKFKKLLDKLHIEDKFKS
eukprot:403331430